MAGAAAKTTNDAMYKSGEFQAVVEKCEGCERIIEVESARYCKAYTSPEAKWRLGICNFATHVKPEITVAAAKINPLKASKRAAAKKKK